MKNFMKILLCFAIASVLITVAFAAEKGMTFKNQGVYSAEKPFASVPATYEAWVKPTAADISEGNCILSSMVGSWHNSFRFSINEGGYPALKFLNKEPDGEKAAHFNYEFKDYTFVADEWAHVAFACDFEAGSVSCYINGELIGTKSSTYKPTTSPVKPILGGTPVSGNSEYFKGEILSVTLYSDTRTADEIKADMTAVDLTDVNIFAHYDLAGKTLGEKVLDAAGNYNMVYDPMWYDDASNEPKDYAYSFAVIGDQQVIVDDYPSHLHYIYDWILANKDTRKIQYVLALGDITNKYDKVDEWTRTANQFNRLSGILPMAICRGNHDYSDPYNTYMNFNGYTSDIVGRYSADKLDNHYKTAKIGNVDYLFMVLDVGPGDEVLEWAGQVTAAHPNHKVVVITHGYMSSDDTRIDANDSYQLSTYGGLNNGDGMWEKYLRKYENIVMVLCGHIGSDKIQVTKAIGDHGNVVTQFLIDPQNIDVDVPSGMVAMFYFNEDGNILTVDYYSTIRNQYYNIRENHYTINIGERSGDMDNDGKVTLSDAMVALRVWLDRSNASNADVNGDGIVTFADVISILKLSVA